MIVDLEYYPDIQQHFSLEIHYVGKKPFTYTSPIAWRSTKYAVSIYNRKKGRLNFYFFKINDDWKMENEDAYSPFIITVYEMGIDNKIKYSASCRISYENYKFKLTYLGRNKQPAYMYLNTEDMDVEVNQYVPIPNTLTLQFVQKNSPLSYNTNYYILLLTEKTTGNRYFEKIRTTTQTISSSVRLNSRQRYEYQLYNVHKQNKQLTVTHETRLISIVTHNTQADVSDLMDLAENHLSRKGSRKATVRHLYRNKPTHHPTIRKAFTTGVMEKYLKDNNGDPGSSINNKIKGLFFMATPKTTSGQIPDESYFGNYRIMIPPEYLVQGCHLYFADFTCLAGKSHYITLVLTKINSKEDRYCKNRLIQLDFNDNPFFYSELDGFYVPLAFYLHIEILYTENVNLVELNRFKKRGFLDFRQSVLENQFVMGESRPGGIPKPSQCNACNLSQILP